VTGRRQFSQDTGDVPPALAARRLGLSIEAFNLILPKLLDRGFPPPDEDTGMYGLEAIDRWRKLRNRRLFPELPGLTAAPAARDARDVVYDRIKQAGRG
jgi:hypothetical protein